MRESYPAGAGADKLRVRDLEEVNRAAGDLDYNLKARKDSRTFGTSEAEPADRGDSYSRPSAEITMRGIPESPRGSRGYSAGAQNEKRASNRRESPSAHPDGFGGNTDELPDIYYAMTIRDGGYVETARPIEDRRRRPEYYRFTERPGRGRQESRPGGLDRVDSLESRPMGWPSAEQDSALTREEYDEAAQAIW